MPTIIWEPKAKAQKEKRYKEFVQALRVKYGIPKGLSALSLKFNRFIDDTEWKTLMSYQKALNIF